VQIVKMSMSKECMWRVSGNRKIVRSDDPWQLGLQQAVAMWAERTDPGIRGSSSDATATLCLRCSTQTWPSRGRVFICHCDMEGCMQQVQQLHLALE